MRCVACGLDAGYNRAVVDTVHDVELGGLCLRCEDAEFGRSLTRGNWHAAEGCAFCDRDGFYALPEWRPYCEERDGVTVCKVDYRVDDRTLRFCDEHFVALKTGSEPSDPNSRPPDETRLP